MQSLKIALATSSSKSIRRLSCLPAIAMLFCASHAFAAVPAVVVDAQQTLGSGFNDPQGIAVAPNGTVYVADTPNNQIVMLTPNLPGNFGLSGCDHRKTLFSARACRGCCRRPLYR